MHRWRRRLPGIYTTVDEIHKAWLTTFPTKFTHPQDGRFDCPDRLFNDLGKCWAGCIDENNMSDVKELTPEFFYCPEIFLNSNKLPLGEMQVRDIWGNGRFPAAFPDCTGSHCVSELCATPLIKPLILYLILYPFLE